MTRRPAVGRGRQGHHRHGTDSIPPIAMPIGPPEDPDRFDDFDECVAALQEDEDLSEAEAERICGSWEEDSTQNHAMTDHDDPQHRAYHQPDPNRVTLREDLGDDDGVFTVRMPIASTGDVRNEGDDPLTRDELSGMATQIDQRSVGVFLDHGASALGGGGGMMGNRYSAIGKVGEWEDPDVVDTQDGDGPALLEATARLMDPETLPAAAGDVREALAALKSQVERDIPLSSSIGWREADGAPGGNDLMEASIVGIPADPRTVSGSTAAVARAAIDAGTDPEALLSELRAVVMGPDADDGRDAADDTVTDEDTPSDEQSEGTTDEQDEQRDAPEWAERMLELQEQQMDTLQTLADTLQETDEDDEDDEDDDDDEDQSADEQSGDEPEEEQSIEVGDETLTADDVRALREQLADAEPETPDADAADEQSADPGETTDTTDELLSPN